MFGGGKAESAKAERTPLVRSGSQGPKPMYLAPRTNSISKASGKTHTMPVVLDRDD